MFVLPAGVFISSSTPSIRLLDVLKTHVLTLPLPIGGNRMNIRLLDVLMLDVLTLDVLTLLLPLRPRAMLIVCVPPSALLPLPRMTLLTSPCGIIVG